MGASIWDGDSEIVSSVNANDTYLTQSFVATEGQTVFTLTEFEYAINTHSLDVEINGVGQRSGIDFTETSVSSFTFLEALAEGDVVYAQGIVGSENTVSAAESAALADADRIAAQAAAAQAQSILDIIELLTPAELPLAIENGGTGQITKTLAYNALSPVTTKGDLTVRDITNAVRLAIGTINGMQLTVDSTTATGLKYQLQGTPRTSRSSNTIITAADSGKYIAMTSTYTQTFDTPTNLTSDFTVELENTGTGNITIPASDGRTNWIMYPGEKRTFRVEGGVLVSSWSKPFAINFIAGGNFIKPPGYLWFEGELGNAGCSGGKGEAGGSPQNASGGGGGGWYPWVLPASLFANSETVTVGAGGAQVSTNNTAGNIGGVSSIGTIITMVAATNAREGSSFIGASVGTTTRASGFEHAAPSNNTAGLMIWGGGCSPNIGSQFASSSSVFGGGAGGSITYSPASTYAAGTSVYAGNGGASSLAGVGSPGVAPSGGGGATQTGANSGAGARGEVRIRGRA